MFTIDEKQMLVLRRCLQGRGHLRQWNNLEWEAIQSVIEFGLLKEDYYPNCYNHSEYSITPAGLWACGAVPTSHILWEVKWISETQTCREHWTTYISSSSQMSVDAWIDWHGKFEAHDLIKESYSCLPAKPLPASTAADGTPAERRGGTTKLEYRCENCGQWWDSKLFHKNRWMDKTCPDCQKPLYTLKLKEVGNE